MTLELWTAIIGGLAVMSGSVVAAILGYRTSITASKRAAAVEGRRIDNEDFQVYTQALRDQIDSLRVELHEEQAENEKLIQNRRRDHVAIRELERKVASLEDANTEFLVWLRAYQASLADVFRTHAAFDRDIIALLAAKGETDLPQPPPLSVTPPPLPDMHPHR